MDAELVHRLAIAIAASTAPAATVRRAVRWADGVALAIQFESRNAELALVAAPGGGWGWWLETPLRAPLAAALAAATPDLVQPLAPALGWRDRDATPLDALRTWMVRPVAGAGGGGWARLVGAQLTGARARPGDRVLEIDFERRDAVGARETWQLVGELFDRGGNVSLRDAAGDIVDALHDRAAARARDGMRDSGAPAPAPGDAHAHAHALALPLAVAAHQALAQVAAADLVRIEGRRLRRDVAHLERLLEKVRDEDAGAAGAQRSRWDAELLAANLHRVRRGQARIEVEDWHADNAPRTIELDPERSPQENVALLFKRAKRGERGHETIVARRAESEARLVSVRAALEALPDDAPWSTAVVAATLAFRALAPRAATTSLISLWSPGGPERETAASRAAATPRDDAPGRRFVLDGEWEVRVGRSNAENDTLTHRFAKPDDVWLHASGVAGSHVVLRMHGKSDNPPREVLERAAAIAARFSKAKHAGTVPVVWTRKRYVRKPRGAPAGLATCTHEKTVFVKPAIPDEDEDES